MSDICSGPSRLSRSQRVLWGTVVVMIEIILGTYSALCTTVLVFVSLKAYRSGGPRVSVRTLATKIEQSKYIVIEVNNNGRGDITLDILGIELSYFYGSHRLVKRYLKPDFDGKQLPFRLQGNSFERWQTPADEIDMVSNLLDPGTSLFVVLKIGGHRRRRIRARVGSMP
jgi:hypothetical protein